jgi:hypothetical protein
MLRRPTRILHRFDKTRKLRYLSGNEPTRLCQRHHAVWIHSRNSEPGQCDLHRRNINPAMERACQRKYLPVFGRVSLWWRRPNPATGLLLGTFDVGSACCNNITQVLPNSALNRAFALGDTPFFSSLGITSYNLTQFTPLAVADLSQLNPFNSVSTSKFIQWGTSGLAFILTTGCCGTTTSQVVLLQSPSLLLATSKTFSPVPVLKSANPTTASHGTGNFRLTLRALVLCPVR